MSLNVDVNFNKTDDKWNVALEGEIDIYTATKLKESLSVINEENIKDVVINMQNLEYIDSTGLGILVGVLKRLKQKEKDIYILNTKANVKKIFTITGLDKIFKLEG
ncbi:anti-anti-sigma factor [Peptoanaerobacter stomatis]|uniref:Anti-sigma factor antagonist n=1 Tax=Peptoanaerobacter stomatis TaxID=796937 RepID=J5WSX8_9FIRM|nr:STAS domain-containing protein [Peptoanaerobacter stomatis]EHL17454.1 anti-anti-sigma factor [Peptoanaerobacter stomatis]EJU24137.1 putative anti-sigma-B factor antagonist [Peptoanaerobacter stomatis]NWO25740.1 STAS domain-containing protein [Peptostreptococcaceae bacterium oral taxon 081]